MKKFLIKSDLVSFVVCHKNVETFCVAKQSIYLAVLKGWWWDFWNISAVKFQKCLANDHHLTLYWLIEFTDIFPLWSVPLYLCPDDLVIQEHSSSPPEVCKHWNIIVLEYIAFTVKLSDTPHSF